jgi:hypothetical protein
MIDPVADLYAALTAKRRPVQPYVRCDCDALLHKAEWRFAVMPPSLVWWCGAVTHEATVDELDAAGRFVGERLKLVEVSGESVG